MSEQVLQQILEKLNQIDERVSNIENTMATKEELQTITQRLDSLESETVQGFDTVLKKIDTLYNQVAHNTEQEYKLNTTIEKITDHDMDIRLIKKLLNYQ